MTTRYPLGRVQHHDPRSLNFLVEALDAPPASRTWRRYTPILDQLRVSSCTGNATTGLLGTAPYFGALAAQRRAGLMLDEALAVRLYSRATVLDGFGGTYPPDDTGSSGLAAAKAAQEAGYISAYHWITGMAAAYTAIKSGPFMAGANWYEGMFTPDSAGEVHATGAIAGGHEFEILGYSTTYKRWKCVNSWGAGWGPRAGYFYLSDATLTRLLGEGGDATVLT